MDLRMTGKQVAVFGAARGIGRAIADGFLAEGARVTGFDRDTEPEPLKEADVQTTSPVIPIVLPVDSIVASEAVAALPEVS